ncbi:MAG: AarF/ABC1/UbiB kinase family protein [Oligoflexales bacterium]|nr:AarF/ABC1/UbiB kinase family protein [Oligoflexales bacterium]
MRLTAEQLQKIESELLMKINIFLKEQGFDTAFKYCFNQITESNDQSSNPAYLYFCIIWLLENSRDSSDLKNDSIEQLVIIAEHALHKLGVRPNQSRNSHLFGRLYRAKARLYHDRDLFWLSILNHAFSGHMTKIFYDRKDSKSDFDEVFATARYLYTMGNVYWSLEHFFSAEMLARDENDLFVTRLYIIKCLRILGKLQHASDICDEISNHDGFSPAKLREITWQKHFIEAQRETSITGLIAALQDRFMKKNVKNVIIASLWVYAAKTKEGIDRLNRYSSIRKMENDDDESQDDIDILLRFLDVIEYCNRSDDVIYAKLKKLGGLLEETRSMKSSEYLILLFAAAIRWLFRNNQHRMLLFLMSEYQQRCASLTLGTEAYPFGLLKDVTVPLPVITGQRMKSVSHSSLKSGIERTLALGSLLTKMFLVYSRMTVKNCLDRGDRERYRDEFLAEIATLIQRYSSDRLRGPMQKAGQLFFHFCNLPTETVKIFQNKLWSGPALDSEPFIALFAKETGRKIQEVFAFFEDKPIAIGSVSQVYRAKLKNGEDVAVKIQYPNFEKAAQHDIWFIKRIYLLLKWVTPNLDMSEFTELLAQSFSEELDFVKEAELYKHLRESLKDQPQFEIPKVYEEYTTKRVMVTELMHGLNFYEYLEACSVEDAIRVLNDLENFQVLLYTRCHIVQIDHHPMNFLFTSGKIICLDFGFHRCLSNDQVNKIVQLMRVIVLRNPQQLYVVLTELGLIKKGNHHYTEAMENALKNVIELISPLNDDYGSDKLSPFIASFFESGLNKIIDSSFHDVTLSFYSGLQIGSIIRRIITAKKLAGDIRVVSLRQKMVI